MPSTPTMAAMPILTPSADSAARTRRLRNPRLATQSRSRRESRDLPLSRTGRRVTDDPPVADLDAAFHGGGDVGVVGDDHDRGAVAVQLTEQFEDGRAGCGVQVAGRLVGHDQGGPAGQGPGNGGALLLAAGQLVRPVATLSSTLSPSSRKNCWNTKPTRQARRPDSCWSDMTEVSSPATRTTPRVGRSRVPITCSKVLLPDPDGPTMAASSPWPIRRSTPASATTGGSPGYSLTTPASSRTGAGLAAERAGTGTACVMMTAPAPECRR